MGRERTKKRDVPGRSSTQRPRGIFGKGDDVPTPTMASPAYEPPSQVLTTRLKSPRKGKSAKYSNMIASSALTPRTDHRSNRLNYSIRHDVISVETPTSGEGTFDGSSTAASSKGYSEGFSHSIGSMTDESAHAHPQHFMKSYSLSTDASGIFTAENMVAWAEDEYMRLNQKFGFFSILFSVVQLLILMMQLAVCGVAPLDINPMVGPYPDVYSEWGGKNAYLVLEKLQIWRFITPAFLHVGVLHLLVNVIIQLEAAASFEREWGSTKWLALYIISEAGCNLFSCLFDPDYISVGSSGALMGLFGAKFAQVMICTMFEVDAPHNKRTRTSEIAGIFLMFAVLTCLSFSTYIDWSGHVGGLGAGFFAGLMFFSRPITSLCERVIIGIIGWVLFMTLFAFGGYWLFTEIVTDEDLADVCTYFRTLYVEGYDCECKWA